MQNTSYQSNVLSELPPTPTDALSSLEAPRGDLHLCFELAVLQPDEPGYFAFPATGIVEVIELSNTQITVVPNTSPVVVGAFNLRGEVLWIVDLEYCLQSTSFAPSGLVTVIIIQDGEQKLGLPVDGIKGMVWLDPAQMKSELPAAMSPRLRPFVQAQVDAPSEQSTLYVLDPAAIMRSQFWAAQVALF